MRYQRTACNPLPPDKFITAEYLAGTQYLTKEIGIGTNQNSNAHLRSLGLDFTYSKPESLVAFLLEACTEENDLVLDFFLGSGTTCAVAHKLNRRYIGIEKNDYIESVAVERLKRVIEGEQGGISKTINWTGGGTFTYLDLSK